MTWKETKRRRVKRTCEETKKRVKRTCAEDGRVKGTWTERWMGEKGALKDDWNRAKRAWREGRKRVK